MEYLLALGVLVVVLWLMSRPWKPKKKYIGGSSADVFGVFNEIFNPAAKNASEVIQEQSRQIKPKPTPEDKPNT